MNPGRKSLLLLSIVVGIAATATESEGKRVGGGKTAGATKPAAGSTSNSGEMPSEIRKSGSDVPPIDARLRSARSSPPAQPASKGSAVAGVAAGAGAGAVAAGAASAADAAALDEARRVQRDLEQARQRELAVLRQKFDEEAKARRAAQALKKLEVAAALEAEQRKRLQVQAQRRAALDREKALKREQQERYAQCRIKPVMTDDEIALCRESRS